ncbi:MAG TPA: response regulator transcription factor, partial [Terriglobia bacterium]|nr:response regulator transcription factor [Terriglobia bacterium]
GIVARVVVLMDDLDGTSYARAFQLGIWGCLSTNQSPMFLQKALDCVARGERWMPQQSVMNGLAEMREQGVTIAEELTPREWQVLGLMANGFRNKEIAARLGISDETVKSHAKSIYGKLKIKGRRDAIFRYFEFIRSQESASDKNPAEPSLR